MYRNLVSVCACKTDEDAIGNDSATFDDTANTPAQSWSVPDASHPEEDRRLCQVQSAPVGMGQAGRQRKKKPAEQALKTSMALAPRGRQMVRSSLLHLPLHSKNWISSRQFRATAKLGEFLDVRFSKSF
jgi:transglutaminase/protease-like cytokinesis protein 3